MRLLKILFILSSLISLNSCIQSTALLGPGITIATTGNVLQAGFQYGANTVIKNETGKDTFEHLKKAVENKNEKKKFIDEFTKIVEQRFQTTRKKLSIN